MSKRKQVLVSVVLAIALILAFWVFYLWQKRDSDSGNVTQTTETGTTLLYAELGGDAYQIIKEDEGNFLYYNGNKEKRYDFPSSVDAISFSLNPEKATSDMLDDEDNKQGGIGAHIFHTTQAAAERYLSYMQLVEGNTLVCYYGKANIFEAYLKTPEGKIRRFTYISQLTDGNGIVICDVLDENVNPPQTLEEIIGR